jgi:hypothetical protein
VAEQTSNGTPAGAAERQLVSYVAEQLWAGRSPAEIVGDLVLRGLELARASVLVKAVEEELRRGGAL